MYFLTQTIPRTKTDFVLPLITVKETVSYITKAKNSSACGHDQLTMHMLKKYKGMLAPHISHLINCSIREKHFPKLYNISKISPYLKCSKLADQIDSYHPVNNLCTGEKIFEQHMFIQCKWFSFTISKISNLLLPDYRVGKLLSCPRVGKLLSHPH